MVRYLSGAEVVEVYTEGSITVDTAIGEAGDVDTAVIDNCRLCCYGYDQRH